MSNKETLQKLVKDNLKDYLFVVASNREPYIHKNSSDGIKCIQPASGLVTALDSVLQASNGVWIAHGSGDADKKVVDEKNRVKVPPNNPNYTLRRIWMNKAEENGYYYGLSNEALWPLCHIVYTKPLFEEEDWNYYKQINQRFADAILDEVGNRKALVFLQDYHLTLVPKMLKEKNPEIKTALFWHIPWPNPEVFRICPWRKEILEGMLGADLLGFHIHYHVDNFMETVAQNLEARTDKVNSKIIFQGQEVQVRPYPISVDYEKITKEAESKETDKLMQKIKKDLDINTEYVAVGTDRIDYTKGLPEKLKAINLFLERYPEYQGRFTYVQVGTLSRIHIPRYKELNDEINDLIEEINWKYSSDNWVPIMFMRRYFTPTELHALYRMGDICIVSALHDGMNLVAKEYVSASRANKGMLVLSRFTGASRELEDAVHFNPYCIGDFADAIKIGLEMPTEEKEHRMNKMKNLIAERDIYLWSSKIIKALLRLAE